MPIRPEKTSLLQMYSREYTGMPSYPLSTIAAMRASAGVHSLKTQTTDLSLDISIDSGAVYLSLEIQNNLFPHSLTKGLRLKVDQILINILDKS